MTTSVLHVWLCTVCACVLDSTLVWCCGALPGLCSSLPRGSCMLPSIVSHARCQLLQAKWLPGVWWIKLNANTALIDFQLKQMLTVRIYGCRRGACVFYFGVLIDQLQHQDQLFWSGMRWRWSPECFVRIMKAFIRVCFLLGVSLTHPSPRPSPRSQNPSSP